MLVEYSILPAFLATDRDSSSPRIRLEVLPVDPCDEESTFRLNQLRASQMTAGDLASNGINHIVVNAYGLRAGVLSCLRK